MAIIMRKRQRSKSWKKWLISAFLLITLFIICIGVYLFINRPYDIVGKDRETMVEFKLKKTVREREIVEIAGNEALRNYILARLYTDKMIQMSVARADRGALQKTTKKALGHWQLALKSAELAEKMAIIQEKRESQPGYKSVACLDTFPQLQDGLFFECAYASPAEKVGMTKEEAEEIMNYYDSFPAGKKIHGLTKVLKIDAKEANNKLQATRKILVNQSLSDADFYDTAYKTAMVTKTSCKVIVLLGTGYGAVTAGAVGVSAGVSFVIDSVDTAIDIGTTTSTIILGEDHKITGQFEKGQAVMAPITAAKGLVTLDFKSLKSVNLSTGAKIFTRDDVDKQVLSWVSSAGSLIDQLVEFSSGGTVMGGALKHDDDGWNLRLRQIYLGHMEKEEAKKHLADGLAKLGVTGLEKKPKTSPQKDSDLPDDIIPMDIIDEIIPNYENAAPTNNIGKWLEEVEKEFIEIIEAADTLSTEDEDDGAPLSLKKVAGTYKILSTTSEGSAWLHHSTGDDTMVYVSDVGGAMGITTNYLERLFFQDISYDEQTGKGSLRIGYRWNDGDDISSDFDKFYFTKESYSRIKLTANLTIIDYLEGKVYGVDHMTIVGYKIEDANSSGKRAAVSLDELAGRYALDHKKGENPLWSKMDLTFIPQNKSLTLDQPSFKRHNIKKCNFRASSMDGSFIFNDKNINGTYVFVKEGNRIRLDATISRAVGGKTEVNKFSGYKEGS